MPVIPKFPHWQHHPLFKTRPFLRNEASGEAWGYHLGTIKYHGERTTLGKVLADLESQLESQEKYDIPLFSAGEKKQRAKNLENLKIKIEEYRETQHLIQFLTRLTSPGPADIPGYEDVMGLGPPIAEPPVSPLHLLDR